MPSSIISNGGIKWELQSGPSTKRAGSALAIAQLVTAKGTRAFTEEH